MKVLHVIHSLDPRSGGPSHAIRQMCRAQVCHGDEVSLLATSVQSAEPWAPQEQYLEQLHRDPMLQNVELTVQRAYGRRGPLQRYAYCPDARRWLTARLSDERKRPDIVHIHGIFSHVTAAAAAAARRWSVPYVLRPTGALNASCFGSGNRWLKRGFMKLVLQRDLQRAAAIHATSTAEADGVRSWVASDKIRVVPLGVQVPLETNAGTEDFLTRFPALRGKRVILFLSRIAPKKRAEFLVAALAKLRKACPDAMLLIAGHDAGGMPALQHAIDRNLIAHRVVIAGFLQGADKEAAFHLASVFALPSVDENFGVAVVEAMAHGVPILVTSGVATHDDVDACQCGRTVDDSVDSIAEGLEELLASDRQTVGRRGREYVLRKLSWPAVVNQLQELYDGCRVAGPAHEPLPRIA